MATATFTTIEARVDQQLTNTIWADEIKDNINQLASAHKSLLVNGGFEVWQRGAGGFTANAAYTADRWQLSVVGGTNTITQETTTVDGSATSLKMVAGSATSGITQKLEDFKGLRGKTLSFSIRVNQSVASGCRPEIGQDSGATTATTSATTGSFVTLTVTAAIASNATFINITANFIVAGTYYLDNAMLVIGPAPAPYQPLHPQEDLARCQRYYEVHGGVATAYPDLQMRAGAAEALHHSYSFNVTKGGTPTVTKNGTWAVSNCGQPSVVGLTVNGYTLSATATGAGLMAFNPNSADDQIVAEFNP